ncbi:MAG: 6,7-dimethyl-8-ribityllumazine synthase [Candidatus Omnitrophica bacterium]|nr:6,7-dimethyl-8-ribityllumazine synthase [Candidatus Omnitrophota bacterium]
MKTLEGNHGGRGKNIAILVSRFNDFITKDLLDGCLQELNRLGVSKTNITVAWVPGSFELPVAALKFAKKKSVDAVICLGAVIRGDTYHFEMVAQGATQGITQTSILTGKPVIFGVLTTDTLEQAYKRCGKKGENKGIDAAVTAVEMINLLKKI